MESLLITLLLIAGLVFLLVSWSNKPGTRHRSREPEVRRENVKSDVFSRRETRTATFDSTSARPIGKPQAFISGAARIIDGDTIVIRKTQIRLFGVDAPELNHPYGKGAKWALIRLCKGMTVTAEILATDDHGRTVAKCTLPDGRDLSAEMVKLGFAIDWPKFSGGVYSALEKPDVRKKLWLADARQKGRIHVWDEYEVHRKTAREAD